MGPVAAVIADIDGNGIPEIAVANGADTSVSIFQVNLGAVPVLLSNVRAYEKNTGVQIEWTTQQEINIERYEVERSENGQQFIKLGSVQALGNSSTMNYKLFDPAPFKGSNFYRVKIIEGVQSSFSQVVKVTMGAGLIKSMIIYPNPVYGNNINIQMNLPKGYYNLSLVNKKGQQILLKSLSYGGGSATERIEVAKSIPPGVYHLKLSGEGILISQQLIKK